MKFRCILRNKKLLEIRTREGSLLSKTLVSEACVKRVDTNGYIDQRDDNSAAKRIPGYPSEIAKEEIAL